MLLLVLILVLIAFSLLVVALLTGSVLWAWVSVGVSVAAAAVLLIDYLQRRSAVKAGTEAGTAAVPARPGSGDVEPVTEVLPVIPRSADSSDAEAAPSGTQQDDAVALYEQGADAQQTVIMPVVQPSASADRPSGASHGSAPSSGDSSPTVTTTGSDRPSSGSPQGGDGDDPPARDGGSGTAAAAASDGTTAVEKPAGRSGPADVTVAVGSTGSGPAEATAPATAPAVEPSASAAEEGNAVGAAGAPDSAASAVASDGEPPEEQSDPAAAAIVATLDAEVVVIDEQPRYHVTGCRSLAGMELIPLPVREAVELGFTPCGWCSPDRTLAGQQTAAH